MADARFCCCAGNSGNLPTGEEGEIFGAKILVLDLADNAFEGVVRACLSFCPGYLYDTFSRRGLLISVFQCSITASITAEAVCSDTRWPAMQLVSEWRETFLGMVSWNISNNPNLAGTLPPGVCPRHDSYTSP